MAIAALLWASAAPAASSDCRFFVRAGFVPPGGTADGRSPESAFPTITAGARAVGNAGDVVCVGPGLYAEGNIGLLTDGTAGSPDGGNAHPVEIRADATGKSTGDAPGPVRIEAPTGPGSSVITTAFLVRGRHDVVIDGFEISGFSDAGIQVRPASNGTNSSNVTIRGNHITDCRSGIDVIAQDLVVIEDNSTIGNQRSGISVEMCLVTSEVGRCRDTSGVPVTPVVSNNRSGGNDAHGIFIQAADDAVVQNNVIYANADTGISLRECNDALIANNLVYANGTQGVAVGKADLASPGTVVLNNTFFANAAWAVDIGSSGAGSPRGVVVNNIVWRNGDGRKGIGVLNENGGLTPVRPSSTCGYVEGFNIVLDEYGSDTPYNTYDVHADPLFVDALGPDGVLGGARVDGAFVDRSADDDFHLRQLAAEGGPSPAVDAGSALVPELGVSGATVSDGRADVGIVDIGFHYGAGADQVIGFTAPFMPLYVRKTGSDSGDGLSPGSALARIAAAAQRARGGVTVVVGPGHYQDCKIFAPANGGKASFLADPTGDRTGDAPGAVLVDAGHCVFDQASGQYRPGETGFDLSSECDVVVDGFHVSGATEDGIRVDDHSDGAVLRSNVVFANGKRGVHVVNSDDVAVRNNLAYDNPGGIVVGGTCANGANCSLSGSRRVVVEFNTVFKSEFNGIQVGDGVGVSSHGTVQYNVTGMSGRAGIEVGDDSTRAVNLVGYTSAYNLVGDRYATGIPRGTGDLLVDLSVEPLYVDPSAIDTDGDWLLDKHFRLVQTAAGQATESRAVDYGDITAVKAGLADRSTRSDGEPDGGAADLGYHYPLRGGGLAGDCNGDGKVRINEVILAVNIALNAAPMSACPAVDVNGDLVVQVNELIRAVNSVLQG